MPADIDLAASIAKGKELFYGDKANCVKCHGVTGLGDGQANDYDDWNKAIVEVEKEIRGGLAKAGESTAGMSPDDLAEHRQQVAWLERFDQVLVGDALRPRTIPPRNLRQGIYRGGRRPLDLYYRIHAGINGAPMPAAKGTVPPEDIWHIVNYIRSLPYDFDGELGRIGRWWRRTERGARSMTVGKRVSGILWSLLFLAVPVLGVATFAVRAVVRHLAAEGRLGARGGHRRPVLLHPRPHGRGVHRHRSDPVLVSLEVRRRLGHRRRQSTSTAAIPSKWCGRSSRRPRCCFWRSIR